MADSWDVVLGVAVAVAELLLVALGNHDAVVDMALLGVESVSSGGQSLGRAGVAEGEAGSRCSQPDGYDVALAVGAVQMAPQKAAPEDTKPVGADTVAFLGYQELGHRELGCNLEREVLDLGRLDHSSGWHRGWAQVQLPHRPVPEVPSLADSMRLDAVAAANRQLGPAPDAAVA